MQRGFISFAGEDPELAEFLSRTLNHVFQPHARFFTSSGGLPPGVLWLEQVKHEIRLANIVLLLLSPRSFDRPWINIEAGAFWANDKAILPLLHGGLMPSDLHRPLSDYQAININSPKGIADPMGVIASHADLTVPPQYDAEQLCEYIALRDRGAIKVHLSWSELAEALQIGDAQPRPESLNQYIISKELDAASYRLIGNDTVELSGYSSDSLLFKFRRSTPMGQSRFLVVNCSNTRSTKSLGYGLFMKVLFNNIVLTPLFPYQRHLRDDQFTGKADGFFPYDVSFTGPKDHVEILVVLWRCIVNRLRLQVYFV